MRTVLATVLFVNLAGSVVGAGEPLLMCGSTEVFLVDSEAAEGGTIEKLWHWTAAESDGIPASLVPTFVHMDECKPVDGGRRILACSSSGGCVLIERSTGRALWHAVATNAHSAELLPAGRVVVASSLSGDHLILFDLKSPNTPLWKTPLHSAHGVVWDAKRERLWALGFDELRCYRLQDWNGNAPRLELESTATLPDESGHDLVAIDDRELLVTTHHHVYRFDRESREFRKHERLGDVADVKSISVHPTTGRTAHSIWKSRVELTNPEGEIVLKKARPYKVRWLATKDP